VETFRKNTRIISLSLFSRTTWTAPIKLVASDAVVGNDFGASVVILEEMAVVGANCEDDNGDESGSVYISWTVAFPSFQSSTHWKNRGGAAQSHWCCGALTS